MIIFAVVVGIGIAIGVVRFQIGSLSYRLQVGSMDVVRIIACIGVYLLVERIYDTILYSSVFIVKVLVAFRKAVVGVNAEISSFFQKTMIIQDICTATWISGISKRKLVAVNCSVVAHIAENIGVVVV